MDVSPTNGCPNPTNGCFRSHDGRLSLEEFTAGMGELGIQLPPDQAAKEFKSIDLDNGGMVLFTEFCAYVRRHLGLKFLTSRDFFLLLCFLNFEEVEYFLWHFWTSEGS